MGDALDVVQQRIDGGASPGVIGTGPSTFTEPSACVAFRLRSEFVRQPSATVAPVRSATASRAPGCGPPTHRRASTPPPRRAASARARTRTCPAAPVSSDRLSRTSAIASSAAPRCTATLGADVQPQGPGTTDRRRGEPPPSIDQGGSLERHSPVVEGNPRQPAQRVAHTPRAADRLELSDALA